MDFSSNRVAVKSVDTLFWFSSNCQNGEPNEDIVILSRLELLPESSSHFLMVSSTVLSRLKQLGFFSVPEDENCLVICLLDFKQKSIFTFNFLQVAYTFSTPNCYIGPFIFRNDIRYREIKCISSSLIVVFQCKVLISPSNL